MENERKQEEFLKELQLEYLTNKLRSLIYQEEPFIKVAKDIASKKRKKIEAIGRRCKLETIFTSPSYLLKFIKEEFWNKNGLPNFSYRDEEQRRVQGNYDKWYLLIKGTPVMYMGRLAEVLRNNPSTETVKIRIGEKRFDADYIDISLIYQNYLWI